jgi:hypothetical protein
MPGVRATAADVGNGGAIAITPNAAPTLTPPANFTTREDPATGNRSFSVEDDAGAGSVTVTAASSVPDLVQSFSFLGSGAVRTVKITPAPNANGTATITLTASDGLVSTDATFTLTVTPVNDAPSFTKGADQTVSEDTVAQSVPGWATNLKPGPTTDEFTQSLTFLVTGNTNSALFSAGPAVNGTTGELTYTPAPNKHGLATITLRVRDTGGTADGGQDSSATQSFTIQVNSVNDAPTATGQSATTAEDTAKALTLGASDVDGDSLTYTVVTQPAHGTLSGTGASRSYTPAENYHGPDSFTFKVNDGTADSNTATVTLTITPVNDAPVASAQSATTAEDTARALNLAGTDVDGNALTYTVTLPAHGTLSGTGASRTYTPALNYHGPDSFTFKVNDGTVDSNTATVSLTVTSVNDLPVATGESYNTPRGTTLEIPAAGVLGNDTDVDGDPLTTQLVATVSGGTLTLDANGGFRYTPRIGFSGRDGFTYRAHDGTAAGNTVTVTLQVSAEPPASTPDGRVEATGTIPVPGGNATFTLSARKSSGRVTGTLTYTDPVRTRTLTSTELTAVVVAGRKARVFGKGRLVNGTLVEFVVDVEDVADPGRGKDRFQLESSTFPALGAVLSLGNVTVRP